jgi:hypothetical protein
MDRWFLDANVLFSAAYRSEAGLLRLWQLKEKCGPVPYLYEVLFSGNIAIALVTVLIFSSVDWSGQFGG